MKCLLNKLFKPSKKPIRAENGYRAFEHALAQRESSNNPTIINQLGYLGLFQFGEAALIDIGYVANTGRSATNFDNKDLIWTGKDNIKSTKDFLLNPDIQKKALKSLIDRNTRTLERIGCMKYLGSDVDGVTITKSGLLAGAHLVGPGGVKAWLQGKDVRDGNNVPVSEYVELFGGYNV